MVLVGSVPVTQLRKILHNRRSKSRNRVGAGLDRDLEAKLMGSVRCDRSDATDAGPAQERRNLVVREQGDKIAHSA